MNHLFYIYPAFLFIILFLFNCQIGELPNVDLAPPLNVEVLELSTKTNDNEESFKNINISFYSYNGGTDEGEQEYFAGYNIYMYTIPNTTINECLINPTVCETNPDLCIIVDGTNESCEVISSTECEADVNNCRIADPADCSAIDTIKFITDHPDLNQVIPGNCVVDPEEVLFSIYSTRVNFSRTSYKEGTIGTVNPDVTIPVSIPVVQDNQIVYETYPISNFLVDANRLPTIPLNYAAFSTSVDQRIYDIVEPNFPKTMFVLNENNDIVKDVEGNNLVLTSGTVFVAISAFDKLDQIESALSDAGSGNISW